MAVSSAITLVKPVRISIVFKTIKFVRIIKLVRVVIFIKIVIAA